MTCRNTKLSLTLEIATLDMTGRVTFDPIGTEYSSLEKAMKATKRFAGKGGGLSVRYAGANGTVYVRQ
jgi:hypothetical protein